MEKDKLIIRLQKEEKSRGWKPITITTESYEKIMDLKEQTGLPPHKIISLILDFAVERIEIQEDRP